jgi:uncharacterized coiled-coil protein SlyX
MMEARMNERATFQKTVFDDGSSAVYSVNLTRAQAWGSFIVTLVVILGSVVSALIWMHNSIASIADREFEKQLRVFHSVARPEIADLIDQKIEINNLQSAVPLDARLKQIENRITSLEVTVSLVVPDLRESIVGLAKSVDRNSTKLDELLQRK